VGPRKPVYAGFNDTHLTEKLRERHHLTVSRESVRGLRLTLRLPAVYRRLPPKHRARRVARPLMSVFSENVMLTVP